MKYYEPQGPGVTVKGDKLRLPSVPQDAATTPGGAKATLPVAPLTNAKPVSSPTTYNVGGVNVTGQTQADVQQQFANTLPATMYPNGPAAAPATSVSATTPTTVPTATGVVTLPEAQPGTRPGTPNGSVPLGVSGGAGAPPATGPEALGTPVALTPPPVSVPSTPVGQPIGDTTLGPPTVLPESPAVTPVSTTVTDTTGLPAVPTAAPGPTLGAASAVPGASVTPFGPDDDLRYQAILPDAGVNRLDLAQQYFDQYAQSTDPAYQQALRAATQRAAANGILGSGMLTNSYGDLATQRAQALDLARQGFLTDALQGTIADNAANRAELRGERDYETAQGQQALQNEINQILLQNQLGSTQFNQQLDLAQLLGQLGYSGNPDEALLTGSSQEQANADQLYQALSQLLFQAGQR